MPLLTLPFAGFCNPPAADIFGYDLYYADLGSQTIDEVSFINSIASKHDKL
jgi:hypothetical protein